MWGIRIFFDEQAEGPWGGIGLGRMGNGKRIYGAGGFGGTERMMYGEQEVSGEWKENYVLTNRCLRGNGKKNYVLMNRWLRGNGNRIMC